MLNNKGLSLLFVCVAGIGIAQPSEIRGHVTDRLLVQPRNGADPIAVRRALSLAGARIEKSNQSLNIHAVNVPEAAAGRITAALERTGLFNFVERDGIARGLGVVDPNDPYFVDQWHLTQIQGPAAWGVTTGAGSVTIAMIDSGVDPSNPDIASKLVPGWNFLTGNSNTMDDLGHGTATAGTAAADTNNGTGVSGVAWNNMIMPLVVLNSSDSASYSDIASAITYAADNGARIINISIGGPTSSSTLQNAVNYAWNKGAVIFASAGNASSSAPSYPAACQYVVAVSATDVGDVLASFSNYGSYIDLSAPGNNILTTMKGGAYGYWYGTSFSAPIAAATAALVLSENPNLSAPALVSLLEQTATDLGAPGWDEYFGYGRVNAYNAVLAAGSGGGDTTPPAASISSPTAGSGVSGSIDVTGTATDNVGVVEIQLWVDGVLTATATSGASPFSIGWNTAAAVNGSHSLTVKAYDAAGNAGTSPAVSVTVNNVVIPPSTVPPVVTIASPANGARVSGNVAINASATDSVTVKQVAIYIDGTLKTTAAGAHATYNWNTRKATAGSHTITATAWDADNNTASTSITVTK